MKYKVVLNSELHGHHEFDNAADALAFAETAAKSYDIPVEEREKYSIEPQRYYGANIEIEGEKDV